MARNKNMLLRSISLVLNKSLRPKNVQNNLSLHPLFELSDITILFKPTSVKEYLSQLIKMYSFKKVTLGLSVLFSLICAETGFAKAIESPKKNEKTNYRVMSKKKRNRQLYSLKTKSNSRHISDDIEKVSFSFKEYLGLNVKLGTKVYLRLGVKTFCKYPHTHLFSKKKSKVLFIRVQQTF